MYKTAELLFRVTQGAVLQDQWRMPDRDGVVAMVRGHQELLRRNAEAMTRQAGRRNGDETHYRVDDMQIAISQSYDHCFVSVSVSL